MDKLMLKSDEIGLIRAARGLRLRSIRTSLGLSRQEFAQLFGLSHYTVQNWESNKNGGLTEQRTHNLVKLLKSANIQCSAEWLLYGTDPAPIIPQLNKLQVREDNASYSITSDETDFIQEELALFYRHYAPRAIHMNITDDSNAPYYQPGDIVAGIRHLKDQITSCVGKLCIIQTATNEQVVRQLKTSNVPGYYNLVCTNPETTLDKPILYDIEITFAAPIIWLRRSK